MVKKFKGYLINSLALFAKAFANLCVTIFFVFQISNAKCAKAFAKWRKEFFYCIFFNQNILIFPFERNSNKRFDVLNAKKG
jgi:hypothetical protein